MADTTDTTTTPTPEPADAPKKRARPPLDAKARDEQAKRRQVANLLRKAKGAKDLDELRAVIDGKAAEKKAAAVEPTDVHDPLNEPVMDGWPTKRAMLKAAPQAAMLLNLAAAMTKETRYDIDGALLEVDGMKVTRRALLEEPLTAVLAQDETVFTPGQTLGFLGLVCFGGTAASHFAEEGLPWLKEKWAEKQEQSAKANASALAKVEAAA